MNLEQLAILGIVIFAFMALTTTFNAVRSFKQMAKRPDSHRVRRLVGGTESAMVVARSVVNEVVEKNEEAVIKSRELGMPNEELEGILEEAKKYFLGRVETRHRLLFNQAVDEIILERKKS